MNLSLLCGCKSGGPGPQGALSSHACRCMKGLPELASSKRLPMSDPLLPLACVEASLHRFLSLVSANTIK